MRVALFGFACLCVPLAFVGCGEKEHAPLLKTVGQGGNADVIGEGGMGGGEPDTTETPFESPHPIYVLGHNDVDGGWSICDLATREVVGQSPFGTGGGFTHPKTGNLIYFNNMEVRDGQLDQPYLAATCGRFTLDQEGTVVCAYDCAEKTDKPYGTAKCFDELGNMYCSTDALVADANGVEHMLTDNRPPHLDGGVHSKPGGGFWLLGLTEAQALGRWSVDVDGTVTFDGEYAKEPGAAFNGFALDDEGSAYATVNIGNVGAVIYMSADFKRVVVVARDNAMPCKVFNYGRVFSTP